MKKLALIFAMSIGLSFGYTPKAKTKTVLAAGNPNLHRVYLTNNDCYKAGQYITPRGIMVHSTGANNPNLRRYVQPDDGLLGYNPNGNHWNQAKPDGQQKAVHAFIGKLANGTVATYQTLPWNMRGWHAGGTANNTHIGFEICEDGLYDATYFSKAYTEAVNLAAYLCTLYGLNPLTNIIAHYEGYQQGIASNHGDPQNWFPIHGKSMSTFRTDVNKLVNPTVSPMYYVQIGAFSVQANANALLTQVKAAGFDGFIKLFSGLYCVQVGAFRVRANADALLVRVTAAGFAGYVRTVME